MAGLEHLHLVSVFPQAVGRRESRDTAPDDADHGRRLRRRGFVPSVRAPGVASVALDFDAEPLEVVDVPGENGLLENVGRRADDYVAVTDWVAVVL